MNDKRAKAIRRAAQAMTMGMPHTRYEAKRYLRERRYGDKVLKEVSTSIRVAPDCTRGLIKKLKKLSPTALLNYLSAARDAMREKAAT